MKSFFLKELKELAHLVATITQLSFFQQTRLNKRCTKMESQFKSNIEMTTLESKNDMKFTFTF